MPFVKGGSLEVLLNNVGIRGPLLILVVQVVHLFLRLRIVVLLLGLYALLHLQVLVHFLLLLVAVIVQSNAHVIHF